MHHRHSRMIKLNRVKLIERIKANKEAHIKEVEEAKEAYIKEANRQLLQLKEQLDGGNLNIALRLTIPVDRSSEYDKVAEMFEWEVSEEIELSQAEFNDYVLDDNDSSRAAKFANSLYSAPLRG